MHVPVAMCTTPSSMWLTMMEWIRNMDTLTQQMWEKLMQVMHFVLHFVQLLVCKISLCLGNESQLKWEIVMTLWNTCAYLYVPPSFTSLFSPSHHQQASNQLREMYRMNLARTFMKRLTPEDKTQVLYKPSVYWILSGYTEWVYWAGILTGYTDWVYWVGILSGYTEQVYWWDNIDFLYSAVHPKAGCPWPLPGQKSELCWQCTSTVHHLSSL